MAPFTKTTSAVIIGAILHSVEKFINMRYDLYDKREFDKGGDCISACTFIASDFPLTVHKPSQDYPLEINIDNGTIYDGGADDNYFLNPFPNVEDYTDKKYGVCLEWNYTDGRATQIIEYIKTALQNTNSVELRRVWLTDYYEIEDRPVIHRQTIRIKELTANHIKQIDNAEIWNIPDKMYPDRPSFYCLTITR